MKKKQVLYLSYDGMTDPLGQSQVLPYIIGGGAAAIGATGAIIAGRDQDLPAGYEKGPRPAPETDTPVNLSS